MPTIEYSGIRIEVDDEGYLTNFEDWDELVASALAEQEGIREMTEEQMDIIKFIRAYYTKYNFFPILNAICKNVHQPKNCVTEQFINPLKAWKIAGLPRADDMTINLLQYSQTPG